MLSRDSNDPKYWMPSTKASLWSFAPTDLYKISLLVYTRKWHQTTTPQCGYIHLLHIYIYIYITPTSHSPCFRMATVSHCWLPLWIHQFTMGNCAWRHYAGLESLAEQEGIDIWVRYLMDKIGKDQRKHLRLWILWIFDVGICSD